MNRKSDDLEAGTKSASERQLRAAAKAALRKADRFWRLAQKASSESYKDTAQNRRVTPLKWQLIKHAKLTSFEQRRIKNETAPRLRAGSDTGSNVACIPQETAVN